MTPSDRSLISVVGLGKLGACMAACLAHKGYKVIGVDTDPRKVQSVNKGIAPVKEPKLQELIKASRRRLEATMSFDYAIKKSAITFIVVHTPSNEDGSYSSKYVEEASEQIALNLKHKSEYHVVVLTSTVLPGTLEGTVKPLLERVSGKKCGKDFGLCYSPEFIALGDVIQGFTNPDLVLIGASDKAAGELLSAVYRRVCDNNPPIVVMSPMNAELTKLALNSFITLKISFANTLAELCECMPGGDVDVITHALGLDSRIGNRYMQGGLGYGGPCFPRDNRAFSSFADRLGCQSDLAKASDKVNDLIVERVVATVNKNLQNDQSVAVLGLTYKPSTNVVEASQAMEIARRLAEAGFTTIVYDPGGMENARAVLGDTVTYAESASACVERADVCIVATPWPEFQRLGDEVRGRLKCVVDCWRLIDPSRLQGIRYVAVGQDQSLASTTGSYES